jgi:hypothetical protein
LVAAIEKVSGMFFQIYDSNQQCDSLLYDGGGGTGVSMQNRCLTPLSAEMYRDGSVNLNKNGVRDSCEDPTVEVEARITDLLARMTMYEKTAQMVTLYGYPRVLKDELPTPGWKTNFWKDGIGNIDEHLNGSDATKPLPRSKHDLPWSQHTRAFNNGEAAEIVLSALRPGHAILLSTSTGAKEPRGNHLPDSASGRPSVHVHRHGGFPSR